MIEDSPFCTGGFRKAFKATSITDGFKERTWVVKKYLLNKSRRQNRHTKVSANAQFGKEFCLADER